MTASPQSLTNHQYAVLRQLANGQRPQFVAPPTRRWLRAQGYVTVSRESRMHVTVRTGAVTSARGVRFTLAITEAGRQALETLPRRAWSMPRSPR